MIAKIIKKMKKWFKPKTKINHEFFLEFQNFNYIQINLKSLKFKLIIINEVK